jgi:stringent starvation protein B
MNELARIKKRVLEANLAKGLTRLVVTPLTPGIVLPLHLITEEMVQLNLSYGYKRPIEIMDTGIQTELSFNQQFQKVYIPWEAVSVIFTPDGAAHKFPTPDEIQAELLRQAVASSGLLGIAQPPATKQVLELIQGGGELTPPRTGHLNLVN